MKLGLGDSYDNTSVLPKKARAYIDITKPASTVGVAGGFLIGLIFYYFYTGQPQQITQDISTIVFASVTMGLAHGASQAMNMAEDAEMDRDTPHKQNRPIPSGIITEEEARTLAWFALMAAVGRAFLTGDQFGVMVTILALFGVFYNLSPIRAKERVISIPWQAVSRGLLMFPAIWAVNGEIMSPTPWVLGVFMFFYVFGFQNSADIIDRDVDEEYGIKTFAVMYGVKGIAVIASGATLLMLSTVLLSVEFGLLEPKLLSLLSIIPFCMIMIYHMYFNSDSVSESTGNHPAWLWFYGGMLCIVALPLATEIILHYR